MSEHLFSKKTLQKGTAITKELRNREAPQKFGEWQGY